MEQDYVAHPPLDWIQPQTREFAWLMLHSQGPVASGPAQAATMRYVQSPDDFNLNRKYYIYYSTSERAFVIIYNTEYYRRSPDIATHEYINDMYQDFGYYPPVFWENALMLANIEFAKRRPGPIAVLRSSPARPPSVPAESGPMPGDPVEHDRPTKYNIDRQAEQKKIYDDGDCPICLAPLTGKANVNENVNEGNTGKNDGTCVVLIPCGHMMHRLCYNRYVNNPIYKQRINCPTCREPQTAKAILYSRPAPMNAAKEVIEDPKKYFGGTHTRTKRYSVTRGCRKKTPGKHRQTPGKHRRTTMRKRCGKKCF